MLNLVSATCSVSLVYQKPCCAGCGWTFTGCLAQGKALCSLPCSARKPAGSVLASCDLSDAPAEAQDNDSDILKMSQDYWPSCLPTTLQTQFSAAVAPVFMQLAQGCLTRARSRCRGRRCQQVRHVSGFTYCRWGHCRCARSLPVLQPDASAGAAPKNRDTGKSRPWTLSLSMDAN